MAKRTLNKIVKGQKGQALPLVLILLVIGGLLIVPTLNYASTSLKGHQVTETKAMELYAADAGVEDALWKIKNDQIPTDPYYLTVNNKNVEVEIDSISAEEFLAGLLNLNPGFIHAAKPHEGWMTVTNIPGAGNCTIDVTYTRSNPSSKKITGLGVWLSGTYTYVEGSAHGITENVIPESFKVESYGVGTAFIWEWEQGKGPEFVTDVTQTETFQFTPPGTPGEYLAWVMAGSHDVWLSTGGTFSGFNINSTANSQTGKWTKVVAHPAREGSEVPYNVSILAWEITQE